MNDLVDDERTRSRKQTATVCYALYALTPITGLTALVAIVIDYIKLDEVRGTWLESHFRWQIRTFWFTVLWSVLALPLVILTVGRAIPFVAVPLTVWCIYRIAKGWLYLNDGRPMYGAPGATAP